MIAVIEYGIGNVSSIVNMLKKIGVDACLAKTKEDILKADKLILPGVGSFDTGMRKLEASGMKEALLHHATVLKKPLLGICLGMQMLGLSSEEGQLPGLGLIPFHSVKFQLDPALKLKIPHMGWDLIELAHEGEITANIQTHPRYYFVHSYYAQCEDERDVLMWCEYGIKFAAAVQKDNVVGFQFHPEKSHQFGMTLLANFAKEV